MIHESFFCNWRTAAVVAASVFSLAACTAPSLDRLERANTAGDSFDQRLAKDYAGFAGYEEHKMYDSPSAEHFAQKGLASLQGRAPQPENPARWGIGNKAMMTDLQNARARLVKALGNGAATTAPAAAARAQVSYDCWVEQSSEGWQYTDIAACRNGFMRAMDIIEGKAKPSTAQAAPVETRPEQPQARTYMVFFDWNSTRLTPEAKSILQKVADNAHETGVRRLDIVGHADRSGPAAYNMRLSQRRAETVARTMAAEGFDRQNMKIVAKGETDPLVPTADGVREPQNRRVVIMFGDRKPGS